MLWAQPIPHDKNNKKNCLWKGFPKLNVPGVASNADEHNRIACHSSMIITMLNPGLYGCYYFFMN